MATDFPASPSNGDTHAGFTYNSTTGTWETSLSTSSIDLLVDVDTTTSAPSTGQLLQWNGTNWVPYTHTSGITEVDQWRLTANITTTQDITGSLERVDDASFAKIGTGMSHSSGVFSFPSTGLYEIITQATFYASSNDGLFSLQIAVSTDGGANWDMVSDNISLYTGKWGRMTVGPGISFVNVTNTTNVKVKFYVASLVTGNYLEGNTDITRTSFTFKRLGDSQ